MNPCAPTAWDGLLQIFSTFTLPLELLLSSRMLLIYNLT